MTIFRKSLIATMLLASVGAHAAPLGNAKAVKGGSYKYNLETQPTTLNPLSSTDAYASVVQRYINETLVNQNEDNLEYMPSLAQSWTISKDGNTFEFTLRDGVKWHDGKPLTAEDVKFSFDAIMHPENKYKTATKKPYYENIGSCEIIAPNKVRFKVKTPYFNNFETVATGLSIVPKHIYENPTAEQEKELNKSLVGTGPYILDEVIRGKYLKLKKNKDWWGNSVADYAGVYNYNEILMRFVKDGTIALQRLEKGDIDFLGLQPEEYVKKAKGAAWGKKVFKVQTANKGPQGYAFVGWNMDNPLFKSKNVRKALTYLFNRELMIEKFQYGLSEPATGPLYKTSMYADESVKPIPFDPKKALEILRAEGWKDTDGDMILDKVIDGKKVNFSFTILEPLQDFVKYLTIFKEDAKQAGIDVNVKFIEWNTFITLLNEKKFEAVRLAWSGGGLDWDPKQIWHSSSADGGGSNFISYKNPKVDKLIDQARVELNRDKRIPLLKDVYRTIADDAPYVFLFNKKFTFYAHTKRMKKVKDTFTYGLGTDYWWIEK
ncbi:ABC transporter, substrate-binding protein, family 5 [Bacteriovorax sp. BSW11_IV]|uniref:ABC transporter substrate-binding protein n=1 Tax=Bacteriovorax sp. BSW11_IV TaxID=1353529 RepID=UPI00038A497F|nr:ABC transporter substrate-binding protein [Bacteriovorax sp. BSW11_IV]EQC48353.1 ABC transporter, substrate-binding protein, family 5 [Bacteriovorax sp. BSW11_IV]